ncbi:MAG: hypothetical protein A2710_06250 [Burkholderiales bacterium RIFCSPHIGHO2_01_FULL_64_960]|nr:MAG: hypothetical protein A2710_06250 [Burkholderiales bacterium RIFCSPHIGHO2_01_FULL_64_960]
MRGHGQRIWQEAGGWGGCGEGCTAPHKGTALPCRPGVPGQWLQLPPKAWGRSLGVKEVVGFGVVVVLEPTVTAFAGPPDGGIKVPPRLRGHPAAGL